MTIQQNPNRETWLQLFKKKQEMTADLSDKANTSAEVVSRSFDLTTYDSAVDAVFAETIVQVLEAIRDKNTFEYIEKTEQYFKYLVVVNLPMIHKILNWGGSIRGAWFDLGDRYGLDSRGERAEIDSSHFIEKNEKRIGHRGRSD